MPTLTKEEKAEYVRCVEDLESRGMPKKLIRELLRFAPVISRCAVAECNGSWDDGEPWSKENKRTKAVAAEFDRLSKLMPEGWTLEGPDDPRGYCLFVRHATLCGNTFGGTNENDLYGIFGSC